MPGPRLPRKIEFEVLLAKTGMTAAELSDASGIPIRTIHEVRVRDYKQPPADRTVNGLARALGVTPKRLLRAIGAPSAPKRRRRDPVRSVA